MGARLLLAKPAPYHASERSLASRRDGCPNRGQADDTCGRAVDHEGEILEVAEFSAGGTSARPSSLCARLPAKAGLRRRRWWSPISCAPTAAAFHHLRLTCYHEQGLRKNNRAENSSPGGCDDASARCTGSKSAASGPAFPEHACCASTTPSTFNATIISRSTLPNLSRARQQRNGKARSPRRE